ncbi:MAG: beta-phosphoglucomutase [Bacteroidia bacterium]|nr:beta-phosphoglucomutase [Bacteroidia bacterium]
MRKTELVIFDLDGVLVHTEKYHYLTWSRLAEENGWKYDEAIADKVKGTSRLESLNTLLALNNLQEKYSQSEKEAFCEAKNRHYLSLLSFLGPDSATPGTLDILNFLRENQYKIAMASSSRNAQYIVEKLGIADYFSLILDGNEGFPSKPAPDIFLVCAKKSGVMPESCLVIEDSPAGIAAAKAAGMRFFYYSAFSETEECFSDLSIIKQNV